MLVLMITGNLLVEIVDEETIDVEFKSTDVVVVTFSFDDSSSNGENGKSSSKSIVDGVFVDCVTSGEEKFAKKLFSSASNSKEKRKTIKKREKTTNDFTGILSHFSKSFVSEFIWTIQW